jgi:hypothetical protein
MMATAQNSPELAKRAVIQEYLENKKKALLKKRAAKAVANAAKAAASGATVVSHSSNKHHSRRVSTVVRSTPKARPETQKSVIDNDGDQDDPEDGEITEESDDDDDDNDDGDIEDSKAVGSDYWTGMTLQLASTKQYKLENINLLTNIELNTSLIQLKSDVILEGILPKAIGVVTEDKTTGRHRHLTVAFQQKSSVITHSQAYLMVEKQ